MKKVILIFAAVVMSFGIYKISEAQTADEYTYERRSAQERAVVPYPSLREADVHYNRRIERIMDTREKQNLVTRWPQNPLSEIIYQAAMDETYEVYTNEHLDQVRELGEIEDMFTIEEVIEIRPDPNDPYYTVDSVIVTELETESIFRYRILEEWVFDKQSSTFFPRIIAVAPLFRPIAEGTELSERPLFWVRFSDLREVLINERMFNRHNDAMQLTYYDFFEMRMFSSYITKEPNEFDFRIADFEEFEGDPYRALLESERIRMELFEEEHDLWEY